MSSANYLSTVTTFRVGGPAREWVDAGTEEELVEAVRDSDLSVLLVGGGSNLLVSDAGFDGRVVRVATRGVSVDVNGGVTAAAGAAWDDVVAIAIEEGLSGFETLSGIPGSAGATPVQNVGAYGEEIASTFKSLRAFDRQTNEIVMIDKKGCAFAYRTSAFKRRDRFVILTVHFQLTKRVLSVPITYAELARTLEIEQGASAPLADVREAVLELRNKKGMVLNPNDTDTFSAGSFFTNPVVSQEGFDAIPGDPPHWPTDDGVKVSAGWLIQRAGFERGYQLGRARLSSKHALAITNTGGATAEEIVTLARKVRDGVKEAFGIELQPEPVLVGLEI